MCDGVSMTTNSCLRAAVRMMARNRGGDDVAAAPGSRGRAVPARPPARWRERRRAAPLSTSRRAAARSAIDRRWCSTWSMPAASPNWRSMSTSAADCRHRAQGSRRGWWRPSTCRCHPCRRTSTTTVARPGARVPRSRGGRLARVTRTVGRPGWRLRAATRRRRCGSLRAGPGLRPAALTVRAVQASAAAASCRLRSSAARASPATPRPGAPRSLTAGRSANALVEEKHIGLAQPRLLDHRRRLVRDTADIDDVSIRRELLEVADDSCDLVRDEYADHMRPPHTKCIERMVRRMACRRMALFHDATQRSHAIKRGADPMAGSS